MDTTPQLKLPYLTSHQAQKHVTLNDSLSRLDALVQASAKSRTLTAQPDTPIEGDAYILPEDATGSAWSELAADTLVVMRDGAWLAFLPRRGWQVHIEDEDQALFFGVSGWQPATPPPLNRVDQFGINADADAINRLVVKSEAELLSYDDITPGSGNARKIINRADETNIASVVFQTGWDGQAEFGLVGQDGLALRTGDTAADLKTAIMIDFDQKVGIGGSPQGQLHVFGTNLNDPNLGDIQITKSNFFALTFLDTFAEGRYISSFSVQRRARGTEALPSPVLFQDWCGGFSFRGYAANGQFVQAALVSAEVDELPTNAAVPMSLVFSTGAGTAIERMRLTSNGRLGLATKSPTTTLHVDGTFRLGQSTVSQLPNPASIGAGGMVFVSDAPGGPNLAVCDGVSWRLIATSELNL